MPNTGRKDVRNHAYGGPRFYGLLGRCTIGGCLHGCCQGSVALLTELLTTPLTYFLDNIALLIQNKPYSIGDTPFEYCQISLIPDVEGYYRAVPLIKELNHVKALRNACLRTMHKKYMSPWAAAFALMKSTEIEVANNRQYSQIIANLDAEYQAVYGVEQGSLTTYSESWSQGDEEDEDDAFQKTNSLADDYESVGFSQLSRLEYLT